MTKQLGSSVNSMLGERDKKDNYFFSMFGESLCKIKNSPFYRPGDMKSTSLANDNTRGLSYDPNRLFAPDKHVYTISDPSYYALRRYYQQQYRQIEYNILQSAIKEQYEYNLNNLYSIPNYSETLNYRYSRTICYLCNKCRKYTPKYGIKMITVCAICKCPMNSHKKIYGNIKYRYEIFKQLRIRCIEDNILGFYDIVVGFKWKWRKGMEYGEVGRLKKVMERLGFRVREWMMEEKEEFYLAIIRCRVLGEDMEKSYLEGVLRLLDCLEKDCGSGRRNMDNLKGNVAKGRSKSISRELGLAEEHGSQMQTIQKIYSQLRYHIYDDYKVAVLLLRDTNTHVNNPICQLLVYYAPNFKPFTYIACSQSRRESIIWSQIFFPQYYRLHSRVLLSPCQNTSTGQSRNCAALKDLLDLNRQTILLQNLLQVNRLLLYNTLSNIFPYSKINYILGQYMVGDTINKLPITLVCKAGRTSICMDNPTLDIFEVPEYHTHKVIKFLMEGYGHWQRCVIILRPIISQGYYYLIVNLFRINNFVLLRRHRHVFTEAYARYLAMLYDNDDKSKSNSNIKTKSDCEYYIKLMMSGYCEILLLSGRSALYSAHVLINGCLDSPITKTILLRDAPDNRHSYEYSYTYYDIFKSVNQLISLYQLLLTTSSTLSLLDNDNDRTTMTTRQKYTLLYQMYKDDYSYMVYSSRSYKITEELAGIFFPECTLFESILVIVKPGYLHVAERVKQGLQYCRYYVVLDKTVQLSRTYAGEIVFALEQYARDREERRQIIYTYASEPVQVFCVAKVSARSEMLSLLASFDFFSSGTVLAECPAEQLLKDVLVPVWNSRLDILKVFNKYLVDLQSAVECLCGLADGVVLDYADRLYLLRYFVGSIYGTWVEDCTVRTGLGIMSYYVTVEETARLQSWYYASVAQMYPYTVPLLYQYRVYGQHALVIQSGVGDTLVDTILSYYLAEKIKMVPVEGYSKEHPQRESLVAYLWAKKLVKLVEQLSGINKYTAVNIYVKGWKRLVQKNGLYQGEHTAKYAIDEYRYFLTKMCRKMYTPLRDNPQSQPQSSLYLPSNRSQLPILNKDIVRNIHKMLYSRLLGYRYAYLYRRLLPRFEATVNDCIRVLSTNPVSTLHLLDSYKTIDPNLYKDNLLGNSDGYMMTLKLYRVVPHIVPKYSLMASIIEYFERLANEALENHQFYQVMLYHLRTAVSGYVDVYALYYEIYLCRLYAVAKDEIDENCLRVYPSFDRRYPITYTSGKKRKLIERKQYYQSLDNAEQREQLEEYYQFDVGSLQGQMYPNVLYNPDDYLHKRWANQSNVISLLRDKSGKYYRNKNGVYVEFEKRISYNYENMMREVEKQAERFVRKKEEEIVKPDGMLEKGLWYRKVKGESKLGGDRVVVEESDMNRTGLIGSSYSNKLAKPMPSQTDTAINKQIQKLLQYKQEHSLK